MQALVYQVNFYDVFSSGVVVVEVLVAAIAFVVIKGLISKYLFNTTKRKYTKKG